MCVCVCGLVWEWISAYSFASNCLFKQTEIFVFDYSLNRMSGYVCVCVDLLESEYDPSKVFI